MNENSLFEMLGILIGFAGIMLILSLLVTAITQALIHGLRIRTRNLQVGLEELLASAMEQKIDPALVQLSSDLSAKRIAKDEADKLVADLVNAQAPKDELKKAREDLSKADIAYAKAEEASKKLKRSKTRPGDDYYTLGQEKAVAEAVFEALKNANTESDITDKAEKELQKATEAFKIADEEWKKLAERKKNKISTAFHCNPKVLSKKILDSISLMREGKIGKLPGFLGQRGGSWILKEELEILLHEQKELSAEIIEKIMCWFSRMERGLSQRFTLITRYLTLLCAFGLAVIFQVSAPEILKRLSIDPNYKEAATNWITTYEEKLTEATSWEDVPAKALEELQKEHETLKELQIVRGSGRTEKEILDELHLAFGKDPNKATTLLNEYKQNLDKLHQEGYEQAIQKVEESVGTLATLNIVPLSGGWEFYGSGTNWLGIFMTTVLLGLGAPFWFNTLKGLTNLRDALSPKDKKEGKEE